MEQFCELHSDCRLKYFCIEPTCQTKTKISCAECQIEGPHKKHELKNITLFKNQIGDIATGCREYLKKYTEPNTVIHQIKEEFEYIQLYTSEVLQEIEELFIFQVQQLNQDITNEEISDLYTPSMQEKQINTLEKLQSETIKQDYSFLNSFDQSFLSSLYHQREQMFKDIINNSTVLFKEIAKMKVMFISSIQLLLSTTKKSLAKDIQSFGQQKNKSQIKNDEHSKLEVSTFQGKLVDEISLEDEKNESEFKFKQNNSVKLLQNYDDNLLLIVTSDNTISICQKENLKVLYSFRGHNSIIQNVIQLNRNYLLTCSSDTSIKLWDISTQSVQQNIKCHSLEVTSLLLFNSKCFISAGKDYMIYFHNIHYIQNTENIDLKAQQELIEDIQQIPYQEHESDSNYQKIQFIKQTHELKYLDYPIKQIEKINNIFFAVGYSNGQIGLVDFNRKQFLYTYNEQHELSLYCLARIDDTYFCSSGGDGKIKVWHISHNKKAVTEYYFSSSSYINKIKVLKENKCIAFSSQNTIEVLSYSSIINNQQFNENTINDDNNKNDYNNKNNDKANSNNNKKNNSKSLSGRKQLLKIIGVKIPKQTEINDFILSQYASQDLSLHTRVVVATNDQKLLFYA